MERNHEDRKPGRNTRRVLAEKVVMEVAAVMTGFRAVDAKAFVALAHPRGLSLHAHLFLGVFTDYNSRNEIKKKIPQLHSITIYLEKLIFIMVVVQFPFLGCHR